MKLDLLGRHALVCGASRGIGLAAAAELAALGASVTLLARSRDALAAASEALPSQHPSQQHGWIAVDMRDHPQLRAKVAATLAAAPVQILVNNSGGPPGGSVRDASTEDFRAAFEQHLLAAQILVQTVLPCMQATGYGRIVNVISTSVKEPLPNLGVSNTLRGAMASWAKTLAGELARQGITVNCVLPGYTRTRRLEQVLDERAAASGIPRAEIEHELLAGIPAGRFGEPGEIAAVIAFLASPAAAYVNGVNLQVDGGLTRAL